MLRKLINVLRWNQSISLTSKGRSDEALSKLEEINLDRIPALRTDYHVLKSYLIARVRGKKEFSKHFESAANVVENDKILGHDEKAYRLAYLKNLLPVGANRDLVPFSADNVSKRTKDLFPLGID